MLSALIPAVALALAPPVPVQRPSAVDGATEAAPPSAAPPAESPPGQEPEAPPPTEAAPAAEAEAAPTPSPSAAPTPPTPEPEVEGARGSSITGTLVDTETLGAAIPNVGVELLCTCLEAARRTTTDAEGKFRFDDLPAGVYTLVTNRKGKPTAEVVALGPGEWSEVELAVEPPTSSTELENRETTRRRANAMIAAGGILEVAALVMLLAAAVEHRKPACKFDLQTCADPPRPNVTRGLGIAGGVFAAGGAILIGVGVHRRLQLKARVQASDRGLALGVTGRF